jgi:hypothetical protein
VLEFIPAFFAKEPQPMPPGDYALCFRGQYYTGRAHNGEIILNPDPSMACRMSLEQAMAKKASERYFSEFQIGPVKGAR